MSRGQGSKGLSKSRGFGRRRRSSSSSSSKSGKQEGDTLPVIPSQFDAATEEHLKRVFGLSQEESDTKEESSSELLSSEKNGILSSEKGDYSFFTPKEDVNLDASLDKLTDEDFEQAVKSAVATIKQLSVNENIKTDIGSIAENVSKSLREFKNYNGPDTPSNFSSPENVFKDVVSELFPNPAEKFTIGSTTPSTSTSNKKYVGTGKLSPKGKQAATNLFSGANKASRKPASAFLGSTTNSVFGVKPPTQEEQSKGVTATTTVKTDITASNSPLLPSSLENIKDLLRSDKPSTQLEGTKHLRQMLSLKRDSVPETTLKEEILPRLLQFLKKGNMVSLQVEALWTLSNLTAGSTIQIQLLIKNNAVPVLVDLLKTNNREIIEQAVWILGNIAGEDTNARDIVLQAGALPILLSWMNCCVDPQTELNPSTAPMVLDKSDANMFLTSKWLDSQPLKPGFENIIGEKYPEFNLEPLRSKSIVTNSETIFGSPQHFADINLRYNMSSRIPNHKNFLKIASWTLSNLCDGQPRPEVEILSILNTVRMILFAIEDDEVLSHVCWVLSHLCEGASVYIEQVVRSQICGKLVKLLKSKVWRVVKPALRTVGNIVCAEDEQDYTQHIIDCGAIPLLTKLISHPHKEIQKEACWTLSNISAGTVEQIQYVLDSGAIPHLVRLANGPVSPASSVPSTEQVTRVRKSKSKNFIRKGQARYMKSKPASSPATSPVDGKGVDPEVRIEACWVLLNATSCGSESQIVELVKEGCVQVLCSLLADATMVLMALEGVEKVLQVGQELGKKSMAENSSGCKDETDKTDEEQQQEDIYNPHAVLLDTKKIEALQKHRSGAIAKRAKRIWKHHFVVCAICNKAFSKHAKVADFCPECKCYVCQSCDCTKFHLSYQDKIWSQIITDEEKNNKKEKTSKKEKTKRQKKREKDKKRKLLQKERIKQEKSSQAKQNPEKTVEASEAAPSADSTKQNDKYVDFLLKNGSILALWNMMNENESQKV